MNSNTHIYKRDDNTIMTNSYEMESRDYDGQHYSTFVNPTEHHYGSLTTGHHYSNKYDSHDGVRKFGYDYIYQDSHTSPSIYFAFWEWFLLAVSILVISLILVLCISKCRQKRKRKAQISPCYHNVQSIGHPQYMIPPSNPYYSNVGQAGYY